MNMQVTAIPTKQDLITALNALPDDWALTPVDGKKASYLQGWAEAPATKAVISSEINKGRAKGVGIIAGVLSGGKLLIDHDGASCDALIEELSGLTLSEALPCTVGFTSNRPGRYQLMYQVPEQFWAALAKKVIKTGAIGDDGKPEQLEFRWSKCQSVVIGEHPQTGAYAWLPGQSPAERTVADAPLWMIEAMLPEEQPAPQPAKQVVKGSEATDTDWALSYLKHIPNSDMAWDDWRDVLMALSYANVSEYEALSWSRQSSKHTDKGFYDVWRYIDNKGGRNIGLGTLGMLAKANGWKHPGFEQPYQSNAEPKAVKDLHDGAIVANSIEDRANRLKLDLQRYLQEPDGITRLIIRSEVCAVHRITKQDFTEQIMKLEAANQPVRDSRFLGKDFFSMGTEALNYLISRFLPAGESILVSAPAGVGKTNLLADMIHSVMSGGNFLEETAAKAGKVLFVSCDESKHSTLRRLKLRGVDLLQLDNLRVWTDLDVTNLSELEQELEDWRPDLVVIDSVTTICMNVGVSEKDPEFARYLYKLKGMLSRYGAAGVLTHHANKDPLAKGINKISGSARIPAAFWGCYTIDRVDQQNPNNPFRFLELVKGREVQEFKLKITINQRQEWGAEGIYSLIDEDGSEKDFKTRANSVIRVLAKYAPKGMEYSEINDCLNWGKLLYRVLDRLEESRQITRRRSSTDARRWVYALPVGVTVSESDEVYDEPTPSPPVDIFNKVIKETESTAAHQENLFSNSSQTLLTPKDEFNWEEHGEEIEKSLYPSTEGISADFEPKTERVVGGEGYPDKPVASQAPSSVTVATQTLPPAARPQGKALPKKGVQKVGRFSVGAVVGWVNVASGMEWINSKGVRIAKLFGTHAKLDMVPNHIPLSDLLPWDEFEVYKEMMGGAV